MTEPTEVDWTRFNAATPAPPPGWYPVMITDDECEFVVPTAYWSDGNRWSGSFRFSLSFYYWPVAFADAADAFRYVDEGTRAPFADDPAPR